MTVWNTIANMQALDASLASFFQVIENEISGQDCWGFHNSTEVASLVTPNGWCWYASYMRYSLRRIPRGKGRQRGPGNLTVGVELWREVTDQDNLWEHAKQPLIYVGFCPGNDYWCDDMALDCLGAPTWYPDGEIHPPTEKDPKLWTWNGEDGDRWSLRSWFFVLQLCSIERREDIEKNIVAPLRSLLVDNSDPNTVFFETQVL
ncbi:MAG: hypothetical protein OXF11_14270 [Deltaproteobacteria bacterium]|nr:hypothetical protein [Deltaproteobacteria bacterium]